MKPINISTENWQHLRARLCDDRAAVWQAWQLHGPGTTEDVAKRAGWDILRFRPRTTELLQLGFVAFVERDKARRAGIYRALSEGEALDNFRRHQAAIKSSQLSLGL